MSHKNNSSKKIWVAWERHRRTIELNKVFGAKLIIYESNLPRVVKHPILLLKTFRQLFIEMPEILIVQNPSVILTLAVVLFKPLWRYKLIVDAHNAGLMPVTKMGKHLNFLYRYIQKKADLTVVTNQGLADLVKLNSGTPYVLPDRIPDINLFSVKKLKGKAAILFICTFGSDEPYLEVIKAAKHIDKNIFIYVTGNYQKKGILLKKIPPNVILTGYLSEEDYWAMLHSVDMSIDLTYREDCLVCGAYESIAAEVPIILSDTKVLKKYFYRGTVFASANCLEIANAINKVLQNYKILQQQVKELKNELSFSWTKNACEILEIFQKAE